MGMMGCLVSLLRRWTLSHSYWFDEDEINYQFAGTANCDGRESLAATKMWKDAIEGTSLCEMRTRTLLLPLLDQRIRNKQISIKAQKQEFRHEEFGRKYPSWSEEDLLDFVELFRTLDHNQNGLVEPIVIVRWLDDLGDTTNYIARASLILSVKGEPKSVFNLDKFLKLIHTLEETLPSDHVMLQCIYYGTSVIQRVRALSSVQQVYLGLA